MPGPTGLTTITSERDKVKHKVILYRTMLKTFIILVLCQTGLHNSQFLATTNMTPAFFFSVIQTTACVIPDPPAKGGYSILGSQDAPDAGSTINENQVLLYDYPAPNILQGALLIYCKNGTWVPEISSCVGNKSCTLPAVPVNGRIINSVGDVDHLLLGIQVRSLTSVKYSCDELFELTGTSSITCKDGSWSSKAPQCQKTTVCVVPDAPAKGNYSILGSQDAPVAGSTVKEFQVLKYDCPAPNILQGASIIVCENASWPPEIPSCLVNKPCILPSLPLNARINIVEDVDNLLPGIQVRSLSGIEYSCDATFGLTGTSKITCFNGSWSSEPPHCQRRAYCIFPDLPVRGSYWIVGSVEAPVPGATIAENKTLRYNCITKYKGLTEQVIVCSDGKWLPGVVECLDTPSDCGDVPHNKSGVYVIQPKINSAPFEVYCDMTLGGQKWTAIQQRLSAEVDFYRNYNNYSEGFGTKMGSHWLGLEHIHEITKGGHHELYIELETHDGENARYNTFIVGNSSTGFRLTISGYSGTAGDSLSSIYDRHNGMQFSTFDKDQDKAKHNCAKWHEGGWWYNKCGISNLNGRFSNKAVNNDWSKIYWYDKFNYNALKTARMLIRRK